MPVGRILIGRATGTGTSCAAASWSRPGGWLLLLSGDFGLILGDMHGQLAGRDLDEHELTTGPVWGTELCERLFHCALDGLAEDRIRRRRDRREQGRDAAASSSRVVPGEGSGAEWRRRRQATGSCR